MAEIDAKTKGRFDLRARVPFYLRAGSLLFLVVAVILVAIGFYRNSGRAEFRMKGFPASLSKDVVAVVDGYERVEMEGGQIRYAITADRATTFADQHQELENIDLKVYQGPNGEATATDEQTPDRITSRKAIYVPGSDGDFTVYFAGNVNVETRDGLAVTTENITYRRSAETADAEERVGFARGNLKGSSFGAKLRIAEKKIELLREFRLESVSEGSSETSTINAGYASYDQAEERIELRDGVHIVSISPSGASQQVTDIRGVRSVISLAVDELGARDVGRAELFEQVAITSDQKGRPGVNINSQYANFEKAADRFELGGDVRIHIKQPEGPTDLRSRSAIYERGQGNVWLVGEAELTQPGNLVKGERIHAVLYPDRGLRRVTVNRNAFMKRSLPERVMEISGNELNAEFDTSRNVTKANAAGTARVVMTPANAAEITRVTLTAPDAIRVGFKAAGVVDRINTEGRTTIALDSPANAPNSSNKKVTADTVRVFYAADGAHINKAEAVGKAELQIEPLTPSAENFHTVVTAPRFDCDFYPTSNNARSCEAGTNSRMVRTPTVRREGRGPQTVTSTKMVAHFHERNRDIERLEAVGSARFVELDRNATAARVEMTQADQVIRLRGGEPQAWDSRARIRANEIDWDTRNRRSAFRGRVSTTYYSQRQTAGATPFLSVERPVFITSNSAEIDHLAEIAVYHGNARAWQDNNYVRADTLTIRQKEGEMSAEGSVQSLLYEVRNIGGRQGTSPVHAASNRMTFDRERRVLRYDGEVDIRQGPDRIRSAATTVFLSERNEVNRTVMERDVVITQPGRKASGDHAQYEAERDTVVLRGRPARVEDTVRGFSEGAELTVYLSEGRVVGDGRSQSDPAGRTRSVYRVQE